METLLLSVHGSDELRPPIPLPCVPFNLMFASAASVREARGLTPPGMAQHDLRLKQAALLQMTNMRDHLRLVCDPEQGLASLVQTAGESLLGSAATSAMALSSAALSQLANSRYGDLQVYEKRLGLMRQYVVQWSNLVSGLGFKRDRTRLATLPLFRWRSGVDGREYASTSLAFETLMAGQLLACNLYNVQQRLRELTTQQGSAPTHEGVQHLFLSHTAEAYRVLAQVCLDTLVKCRRVLCREAALDLARNSYAAALGDVEQPPPDAAPECSLQLCVARMSQCLVRMHHHNSKRMLACVLRRTNRVGERREAGYSRGGGLDEEAGEGESTGAAAPHRRARSPLMWPRGQLEQANALDVALGAQWTLRQLTLLEFNLASAAMPPPSFAANKATRQMQGILRLPGVSAATGLLQAAAAKTRTVAQGGAAAAVGLADSSSSSSSSSSSPSSSDSCVPRLEVTNLEAFLAKQYALAVFLDECCEQLRACADDEAQLRQLVTTYSEMYGGGQSREAIFWSLARMSTTEVNLLQLRLMEDACEELQRHRKSAWSARGLRELWRRMPGRGGQDASSSSASSGVSGLDSDDVPPEEDIEDERARSDFAHEVGASAGADPSSAYEAEISERMNRQERLQHDRSRLAVRAEQLIHSTPLESAMVGLLGERCHRMRERLHGALAVLSLDAGGGLSEQPEAGKRIRRVVCSLSSLFLGSGVSSGQLFYGYHIEPLSRFAACLSVPYLQELASLYPPLGFF